MHPNDLSGIVLDSAIRVHSTLGPGLLESAYEVCLSHELRRRGLRVLNQVALPIEYDGVKLDAGYRLDLLIEDSLIIELKSVEKILPIHEAQMLTYLKLSGKPLGILLNFNEKRVVDGFRRFAHGLR